MHLPKRGSNGKSFHAAIWQVLQEIIRLRLRLTLDNHFSGVLDASAKCSFDRSFEEKDYFNGKKNDYASRKHLVEDYSCKFQGTYPNSFLFR